MSETVKQREQREAKEQAAVNKMDVQRHDSDRDRVDGRDSDHDRVHRDDVADAIGRGEKFGNIRNNGKDGVAGTADDVTDVFRPSPSAVEDAGDPAPRRPVSAPVSPRPATVPARPGTSEPKRTSEPRLAEPSHSEADHVHPDADHPERHGHRRKVRNQPGDKFTGQFHYEYD